MTNIAILNDAHWHELRSKTVGASESAALFGLLPWLTPWQLHMIKAGKLPAPDIDDVKHIKQGKHFEAPIAGWASEKFGITLQKVHRYITDDECPGMGASLDYQQVGTGARIPTEIKWVLRTGDHWEYDGDEIIAAPDYYLLQVQHQLACTGASEGQLIAFINGDVRRAVYKRRDSMIGSIRDAVRDFWVGVKEGIEPPIDFKSDADAVMKYAAMMPVRSVEWTPQLEEWAQAAYLHAEDAKYHEKAAKGFKAQIADALMRAAKEKGANDEDGKVVCEGGGWRITRSLVAPNEGTLVTQEMVGTRVGARKGYPLVTVSQPKEKKGKKEAAE